MRFGRHKGGMWRLVEVEEEMSRRVLERSIQVGQEVDR